jgi:hypothetical protein
VASISCHSNRVLGGVLCSSASVGGELRSCMGLSLLAEDAACALESRGNPARFFPDKSLGGHAILLVRSC